MAGGRHHPANMLTCHTTRGVGVTPAVTEQRAAGMLHMCGGGAEGHAEPWLMRVVRCKWPPLLAEVSDTDSEAASACRHQLATLYTASVM